MVLRDPWSTAETAVTAEETTAGIAEFVGERMCNAWKIAADADGQSSFGQSSFGQSEDGQSTCGRAAEIAVMMSQGNSIRIEQGDAVITVSEQQLGALSDKLYFLSLIYQADAQDALENLCCG